MFKDGTLYWITGLSGSGKTTIGKSLYNEIKKEKDNVVFLDGDAMKGVVDNSEVLTYTDADRRRRAMQYAKLCKLLTDQGMIVVCCTISMFDAVREWNRNNNKRYVEVFLNVPMEVLCTRDKKGLYSGQKQGKVNNVMGLDMQTEFPKNPDVEIVNDGKLSVSECVERISEYMF